MVRVGLATPGGSYTVVAMSLDAYVARVLAGEAVHNSSRAALEALAITVRTFAAANRGRHRADGFDLCDQTHCQVLRTATAATERAAETTTGRLLLRGGTPAVVYYSASCGGHTALPSEVWPGHDDPSYLPSRIDDACEGAPAWSAEIARSDLLRALRSAGFRGELRDMRIASRNGSGRVAQLRLDGLSPDQISGQDLRVAVGRTLGWQHIKSAAFELQKRGDAYRFTGHGSGHGVGLCVIGSARLAERGVSADAILARYFPGLEISGRRAGAESPGSGLASGSLGPGLVGTKSVPTRPGPKPSSPSPDPGLAISLPDDDEGERAAIERQTRTARDELARTLGVPAPARLTLRFHPTTDAYEQATGRAWFTSATIVNGELHLLPLATLRDRGVLDRTIRHELVHLLTDGVLASRAQWVREGAAIYFAGDQPIPSQPQRPAFRPEPKASCPTDAELLRPVSVGALSNAYARARACFAKKLESAKSWRDVK
jgi:SpoIID/LytB domain protein